MRKRTLMAIACVLCIMIGVLTMGCLNNKKDLTLNGVGMSYGDGEYKPMEKIRTLDDIYFPEGLLETELGMWIYNGQEDEWYRTDSEEGRAAFDQARPTFISTHGMGCSSHADDPDIYYAAGYNVICFMWGAYADEDNSHVGDIVDKVWLSDYNRYDAVGKTYYVGARWEKEDGTWEEEDPSDASVIEMYCAFYYDLFSHFPDYAGSSIHVFGHSYGGMISIGATSLLTTAYKCGLLPAYMLPDVVTLLDPYFMRCSGYDIAWLGEDTPAAGNIAEIAYQTALDCQKLGIAVQMFRFTKSVAFPATLHYFADKQGGDLNISYWNFVNSVLYAHLTDNSIAVFNNNPGTQHNYAWDWYTEYYTGKKLTDACATKTEEQAFCFEMDYDASFARTGIKYNVDLNGTTEDTDDDILYSFYREYKYDGKNDLYPNSDVLASETLEQVAELHGKAKIAGFVFLDQNGNGKLDERIKDHLSGAKVTIFDEDGNEVYSTETTINGFYEYEVEKEGKYTIKVKYPRGYKIWSKEGSAEVETEIVDAYYQLSLHNFGAVKK